MSDNEIISPDTKDEENIGNVLTDFVDSIISLSETFPITMTSIITALQETLKRREEFDKENVQLDDDDKDGLFIREDAYQEFLELSKKIKNYGLALHIVPQSLIVSLISQYDAFLGELLKKIFLIKPEMLNASEKPLTLAQLIEFGSVENAKNFVLEKEVESVLRKSHVEQFQWMESKFDIPLRKGLDVWPRFVELTERRNLFVHTDGVISSQYIKVCKENGVSWKDEIKLGDELEVTPKYFADAVNIMYEIGVKLAHVLWRKFKIEDLEEADGNLLDIAYEPLIKENYELAKVLFTFATNTLKKHFNQENRRIFLVNKALAYKWSGDDKKAKELISAEDWSDTRDKFRLAEAAILEDYPRVYQLMQEIGDSQNEVEKDDYRIWPLFKALRDEPEFAKTFEEIFGEPLTKLEVEIDEDEIDEIEEAYDIGAGSIESQNTKE